MPDTVYTIGHSNHPVDAFLALLKQHRIDAVADVRSAPYSRRHPQYRRENLKAALHEAGVHYVFLGRELGARSEDPSCYIDGKVQYDRLANTALFRSGLERVIDGAGEYRIALMCAEKEPLDCHRTILVARELERRGLDVVHILAGGTLETHKTAVERLAKAVVKPAGDLFPERGEIEDLAYRRQAEKIAFIRNRPK